MSAGTFTFSALGGVTASSSEEGAPGLAEFRAMALDLMARHHLDGWSFRWDKARHRAGECQHGRQALSFSAPLMATWEHADQRDVILHEIAHALCGPGMGHGEAWQLTCIRIGAKPERCYDESLALPSRWTGTCPAGHEIYRERLPRKEYSCTVCNPRFDRSHLLTWTENEDA